MSRETCGFEDAVTAAAKSGEWSAELVTHRESCMACAELTLVVAALAEDEELLMDESLPLPDPAIIWFRARLAERQRDYRRATRAIVWVQRASIAVVAAVALALAPGLWSLLARAASRLDFGSATSSLPRAAGSPTLVVVASLLVLGGLALWELTAAQER
jgi:hypothetical protein